MPISVACSGCEKTFKAPDHLAGKAVKCPGCKGVIKIPVLQAIQPVMEEIPSVEERPASKRRPREETEVETRSARRSRQDEEEDEDDRSGSRRRPVERLEEPDSDLPAEPIDLESADLPAEMRGRIEEELGKGEKLYWVGMPSRRIILIRSVFYPILGTIVFLVVLAIFVVPSLFQARDVGQGMMSVLVAGGLAVFALIGGILTPLLALWRAGRTCYALTNRRAIVWQAGFFGGVEMENYNAARLSNMRRRDLWIFGNGGGDLVFRSVTIVTVRTSRHSSSTSESTTYYGFLAIENARQVERLVREVLVDR